MNNYQSIINNENIRIEEIFFPASIDIQVTELCDLNCKFCSQCGCGDKELELNKIKNILDEAKLYGVMNINYTGGEPLLHKDFIKVLDYGNHLNLKQTIVTNGVNLDYLSLNLVDMVDCIGISIHGFEDTHDFITGKSGTYSKVISNIERIRNSNKKINIIINYTCSNLNNNLEDITHVKSICDKYNCLFNIGRINEIGRSRDQKFSTDLNELLKNISLLDDSITKIGVSNSIAPCIVHSKFKYLCHGCSAGIASIAIDSDGNVKICPSSNRILGNIKNNSLYEIWNSNTLVKFRQLKWIPNYCKSCKDLHSCRGGCKAEIELKGDICFGDKCVLNHILYINNIIENNSLSLTFEDIRGIDENNILILSNPIRIVNKKFLDMILDIDGIKTGKEILELYSDIHKESEINELLRNLYKDGHIVV